MSFINDIRVAQDQGRVQQEKEFIEYYNNIKQKILKLFAENCDHTTIHIVVQTKYYLRIKDLLKNEGLIVHILTKDPGPNDVVYYSLQISLPDNNES